MDKTKEALGRKSRQLKIQNQNLVFMAVAEMPLSFTELLEKTKLSRASLTQHLKELANLGFIYKDTIKSSEFESIPPEVGKVVYRMKPDEYGDYLKQAIEIGVGFLYESGLSEENTGRMEAEIDRFVDSMVQILSDDTKQRYEKVKKHLEGLEHSSG
jgi:DNA-binding transcriptional ArsR family regulator